MVTVSMCCGLSKVKTYLGFTRIHRRLPINRLRVNAYLSSDANLASKTSEESSKSESVDKPSADSAPDPRLELAKEKESLLAKVAEIDDKYKRALAETENVRQRLQRQIQEAKLFGIQGFCKDLLEVADVLQKATSTVPSSALTNANPHLKNLYEGLMMTEVQMQKVFRNHGLHPFDPLGERFNPNVHEALFEQVVEGKEPGTVAVVTKIGYKLHERVIRPALVGVVKAPS